MCNKVIEKYIIVERKLGYKNTLAELVNDKIQDGWVPQGGYGICKVDNANWEMQAMVKYKQRKENDIP